MNWPTFWMGAFNASARLCGSCTSGRNRPDPFAGSAGTSVNNCGKAPPSPKALHAASPSFDEPVLQPGGGGRSFSGSLPQILRRLAETITQMHELQSKVVSAMVYPAFLLGALAMLLVVFSTVLIPQLSEMLSKSRQKLPAITEFIIAASSFVGHWWWLGVLIVATAIMLFRAYVNTDNGRKWWHRTRIKLPLFGPVLSCRFYAQFASSLGTLTNNGVPLLNGMRLCAKATANVFLRAILVQATTIIGEGVSLSGALRKAGAGTLPPVFVDMVSMGESTGRLGHSLVKISVRYDKELDKKIKAMTALITPVMLIFMFLIVGVVAYAIVQSIFSSMANIRH